MLNILGGDGGLPLEGGTKMIKVIEMHVGSTRKMSYSVEGDILTVTINGVSESFDFSDLPDGKVSASGIEVEHLIDQPIFSVTKENGITTIELLVFYSDDEKEVFERGYNQ